jgi:dihydroorotate dehydrogenase
MPDWTYHPFFKPILFRLPAETGRRLTLRLLEIQARTSLGRRVFRLFGHGPPPPELATEVFGLRFPAPVGLGAGIDTHGVSVSVMQHLGFGFMVVGPVGADAVPRRFETDPLRIAPRHALVSSARAGAPGAAEMAERLRAAPELGVPIGVALRGARPEDAIAALDEVAAFYVLSARDLVPLAAARAATKRPILVALSADLAPDAIAVLERAAELGADGCVALGGVATELLPEGELTGPFLRDRVLETIARVVGRFGDRMPVVASGAIMSPKDALACLDAGAVLVSLYEGLVFAGPGLPGRIVHALESRTHPPRGEPAAPPDTAPVRASPARSAELPWQRRVAWQLLALTGGALMFAGVVALGIASTVYLLPYDVHFLGMTVADLCGRNACRIVHFMAHDRVSFGGSILSIGVLYVWLATEVREGRAWAWWTLLISGVVGFASFLTYLEYGYLDPWHALATLALLPCFFGGLALSYGHLDRPRGPGTLFRPTATAWAWSPAGRGRLCLSFSAAGMILGGIVILCVGMTRVFVPQDLAFMGLSVEDLHAVSPRLVPLIAHDRAGFGGGLFSGGLTVMFTVWCGTRPGARGLWWALLVSGVVGFGSAIGVHPIVGYTSFVHLAPAYAGAIAFVVGMALLYAPMCRVDGEGRRFPDV